MYTVGKHETRLNRRRGLLITGVCIIFVAAAAVYAGRYMRTEPKQHIRNTPGYTTTYNPSEVGRLEVAKPQMTLKLPYGWSEKRVDGGVNPPLYRFQAEAGAPRQLDIYLDNIPQTYALNKVVAVNSMGQGLNYGAVSENCSTFTDNAKTNAATGYAPAKWQGVDFTCDMGNYTRQVVGTASTDGMNYVMANGAEGKKYKAFFVYTDNNINPDYSTLYAILAGVRFQ